MSLSQDSHVYNSSEGQPTLAAWPMRTTLSPARTKPSTMLSVAALVSAHASSCPMASLQQMTC